MTAIREISLECDGGELDAIEVCNAFFDARVETVWAARKMAEEKGWRLRLIGGRQHDLCPVCLEELGMRSYRIQPINRISHFNPREATPTRERERRRW